MENKILDSICNVFKINRDELHSKSRKHPICDAKSFAMYFLHRKRNVSLSKLAKMFNCTIRNVQYSVSKIENGMRLQLYYRDLYKKIKKGYEP